MAEPLSLPKLIAGMRSCDWQDRFDATFTLAQMDEEARERCPP